MQIDTNILYKAGFFSNTDYYFSENLLKIAEEDNQIVKFSAALVSKLSQDGHICIDIPKEANKSIIFSDQIYNTINEGSQTQIKFKFPSQTKWINELLSSKLVGNDSKFPLVLDSDNKLYLSRYFDYQKRIVKNILLRTESSSKTFECSLIETELDKHFKGNVKYTPEENQGISLQKKAAQKALQNNFLIISGGPGTGKTHITDIIAKSLNNLYGSDTPLKIVNTAPTGKAASKLQSGITIHRLLKINTNSNVSKKTVNKNINADCVIIDEASMIDISLMAKLLEAIPLNIKVVIIGDKNQLGSIETGSVFNDLCKSELLKNFISNLEYNFRSGDEKKIDALAKAINKGDDSLTEKILTDSCSNNFQNLRFINISDSSDLIFKLKELIIEGYAPCFQNNNLDFAFKNLNHFRILCSHRNGFFGTNNLNMITEKLLQGCKIHNIKQPFPKSILMITKNDYNKLLFNGDTGIVVVENNQKKVFFIDENSYKRSFNLTELNAFEKAFAITIHKSQGSEFDNILLIVPQSSSNILTRELIYTAITRARKKVTIAGNINVIKKAVRFNIIRESGLTKMLDRNLLK